MYEKLNNITFGYCFHPANRFAFAGGGGGGRVWQLWRTDIWFGFANSNNKWRRITVNALRSIGSGAGEVAVKMDLRWCRQLHGNSIRILIFRQVRIGMSFSLSRKILTWTFAGQSSHSPSTYSVIAKICRCECFALASVSATNYNFCMNFMENLHKLKVSLVRFREPRHSRSLRPCIYIIILVFN